MTALEDAEIVIEEVSDADFLKRVRSRLMGTHFDTSLFSKMRVEAMYSDALLLAFRAHLKDEVNKALTEKTPLLQKRLDAFMRAMPTPDWHDLTKEDQTVHTKAVQVLAEQGYDWQLVPEFRVFCTKNKALFLTEDTKETPHEVIHDAFIAHVSEGKLSIKDYKGHPEAVLELLQRYEDDELKVLLETAELLLNDILVSELNLSRRSFNRKDEFITTNEDALLTFARYRYVDASKCDAVAKLKATITALATEWHAKFEPR
ncbi:Hypothetical protein POVN_LOCUS268 [uncultured virus]|nr:Hypothetical protein POVN_LOCUS268 [uncultured virus]